MVRKCSECGNVGHNSRTCSLQKRKHRGGRFKLFGVQLDDGEALLKKSISLDSLPSSSSSSSFSEKSSTGYLSNGFITKTHERKKGVPWSEEEHRVFLVGLEKLGKGDWRGISSKFVITRTPTQVASHAQKYFLRLATLDKRKRGRPNRFDAASARGKLTVQVVEGSDFKPSNLQPSSNISFGIPSKKRSNSIPIENIAAHSGIWTLNNHHHHNSVLPINWFGYDQDEPCFKLLQGPIVKSSSSKVTNHFQTTHHHQAPDLQLSLSTPKAVEQAKPCCRTVAMNGAISVT